MMNTYDDLIKTIDEVVDYFIEILGNDAELNKEEIINYSVTPIIENSRKLLKLSKEEIVYLFGNPILPDDVIESEIDKLTRDRM